MPSYVGTEILYPNLHEMGMFRIKFLMFTNLPYYLDPISQNRWLSPTLIDIPGLNRVKT